MVQRNARKVTKHRHKFSNSFTFFPFMSNFTYKADQGNLSSISLSFQQPPSSFKSIRKTSSFADLQEIQTQLETQKKVRDGIEKLWAQTVESFANGKYAKDPEKKRQKAAEAQRELVMVNRQIAKLERQLETSKRMELNNGSGNNTVLGSSFSQLVSSYQDNQSQAQSQSQPQSQSQSQSHSQSQTSAPVQPPAPPQNRVQNVTFSSAHNTAASTPTFWDKEDTEFDDSVVRHSTSSEGDVATSPHNEVSAPWLVSDILQSLGLKNEDEEFYITQSNKLVEILRSSPEVLTDLVFSTFGHRIQNLLLSTSKEVVACGYRLARYLISDCESIRFLKSIHIHTFVILSLAKTTEYTVETEQALKLVRKYFDIENGVFELSLGVANMLVASALSSENETRFVALETLCELTLLHPKLVADSNGLQALTKVCVDGPMELAQMCGIVLVKALDMRNARKVFRNGQDLSALVSYFVNNINVITRDSKSGSKKAHLSVEKLHNCAFMISSFLKTWVGLSVFAHNDCVLLSTLIESLSYDIPILRDILMDIFFDVLRIRNLPWISSGSANMAASNTNTAANTGKTSASNGTSSAKDTARVDDHNFKEANRDMALANHFGAIALTVFLEAGLLKHVNNILFTSDDELNKRKALFLMVEMYNFAENFVPECIRSKYFESSKFLEDSSASFQLEKMTRKLLQSRTTYNINPSILKVYGDYFESVSSLVTAHIDDIQLRKMIDDTKVLFTKKFLDWKWDIILEIIKGPLRIEKSFEDCLKNHYKFLKTIMSFFRPFKKRYMLIKKTKNYQKYVQTGVALFETLMSHEEGIKYFSEDKLLPQIAECLAQVDSTIGIYAENPIFGEQSLETTLSSGYFAMLGVLSRSKTGLQLMRKWKVFSILHHIVHERGREDLILCFLKEFDFNLQSQLRVLYDHAATSCDPQVRVFATTHLSQILKQSITTSCTKWAIGLLIRQLYDPNVEVCKISVSILDQFCTDPLNVSHVLKRKPSLDHLGNIGAPLLLRFLSDPLGLQYLLKIQFVHREMEYWLKRKHELYVLDIESFLYNEYQPFVLQGESEEKKNKHTGTKNELSSETLTGILGKKSTIPHHFYGELVKTSSGFALLQQTDHFQQFVSTIKNLASKKESSLSDSEILTLKGCLWTVGHVASSKYCVELVDESGIIEDIIELCQRSRIWSIKGTIFYILGMVGSTPAGLEILDEFNWDVSLDANNEATTFCIPKDIGKYLDMENEEEAKRRKAAVVKIQEPQNRVMFKNLIFNADDDNDNEDNDEGSNNNDDNDEYAAGRREMQRMSILSNSSLKSELQSNNGNFSGTPNEPAEDKYDGPPVCRDTVEQTLTDEIDKKIIEAVSNFALSTTNNVRQLTKLESKHKDKFSGADLFLAVMYSLENYKYKLSSRSFILQLFNDKKGLENVIRRDRTKKRNV